MLVVLALSSFAAIGTYFVFTDHHGWVGSMVHASTAQVESPGSHHGAEVAGAAHDSVALGTFLGMDPHKVMYYVSAIVGLIGIAIAFVLHLAGRTSAAASKADALLPALGPIPRWAQNKWYVDEFYNAILRVPLLVLAHVCHWIDKLLVDGVVDACGWAPGALARAIRPTQGGQLQGYATAMAGGLVVVLLLVLVLMGVS